MSIPFYEWFYKVILTSANSVPIQSLWVAFFANPIDLNRAFQTGNLENGFGYYTLAPGAGINTAQGALGALFANSVTIPGDGMNTSKIGPDGMGPIKGMISSGRKDMENLTISFLDTNISFCDYNLRPWAIYASHKSLKDPSVKTTITVIQLTKTGFEKPLLPRAIWTFHDACPVSISSEQWNYGSDNVISRQVEFAYNYYTLNADPALTPALAVASVLGYNPDEHTNQPIGVDKGGLTSHGSSQIVNPPSNDSTSLEGHTEGQQVLIPTEDMVSRGVNIGLNILNGNSNVTINSDDAITRLKDIAVELQSKVNIPLDDVPEHSSGTNQVGYVEKLPTGPSGEQPDHITREAPERVQSGRVPVGGNSKANAKGLADTPLFFPGDGDENNEKISGRTVGGTADTPNPQAIQFKQVVVERTGDVSKNIPLQIININRQDMREGGRTNNKSIVVNPSDVIEDSHASSQIVTIPTNDDAKGSYGSPQEVVVNRNDTTNTSYGEPNIVQINTNDATDKNYGSPKSVIIGSDDGVTSVDNQEVVVPRNDSSIGEKAPSQIVTPRVDDRLSNGSQIRTQQVKVNTEDKIGDSSVGSQKVEVKRNDTVLGSNIEPQIVKIKRNDE